MDTKLPHLKSWRIRSNVSGITFQSCNNKLYGVLECYSKGVKEGRFKLTNWGIAKMTIDTNPFLRVSTNMILTLGCNFHPKIEKGKWLM